MPLTAVVFSAALAAAAATANPPPPAAGEAEAAAGQPPERVICTFEVATGTKFTKKVCRTKRMLDEQRAASRKTMDTVLNSRWTKG